MDQCWRASLGFVAQSLECPTKNLALPKPVPSYSSEEEGVNIYLCHYLINVCLSQPQGVRGLVWLTTALSMPGEVPGMEQALSKCSFNK